MAGIGLRLLNESVEALRTASWLVGSGFDKTPVRGISWSSQSEFLVQVSKRQ